MTIIGQDPKSGARGINLSALKGYRTFLIAGAMLVYAVLQNQGVDVPVEPSGDQALAFSAQWMIILRLLTNTPPAASQ